VPRVFFAVWPDAASAQALHQVARTAADICGGRIMRRDGMHVTLAFLGDIPAERVAAATRVADGIAAEAFTLTLDRLGYWRHNRILWAGGVSPRLTFVAAALVDGLRAADFALDARPFVPHLTLLRDAYCGEPPPLPPGIGWSVNEFVLAESRLSGDGARYEIVGRWPLARADA
jgi:2'-5' RNA ligase